MDGHENLRRAVVPDHEAIGYHRVYWCGNVAQHLVCVGKPALGLSAHETQLQRPSNQLECWNIELDYTPHYIRHTSLPAQLAKACRTTNEEASHADCRVFHGVHV